MKRRGVKKKKARKVRRNPVTTYIKVFQHGGGKRSFAKKGYFTGSGWDTDIRKAKKYSAGEAKRLGNLLKIPPGWGIAIVSG